VRPWELLPGTTLDDAKIHGAMWKREWADYAESLFLPGYIVSNLGYIPSPQIAWLLNEMARVNLKR
jgi:hypothetical protein